jgi:hypothetical protein
MDEAVASRDRLTRGKLMRSQCPILHESLRNLFFCPIACRASDRSCAILLCRVFSRKRGSSNASRPGARRTALAPLGQRGSGTDPEPFVSPRGRHPPRSAHDASPAHARGDAHPLSLLTNLRWTHYGCPRRKHLLDREALGGPPSPPVRPWRRRNAPPRFGPGSTSPGQPTGASASRGGRRAPVMVRNNTRLFRSRLSLQIEPPIAQRTAQQVSRPSRGVQPPVSPPEPRYGLWPGLSPAGRGLRLGASATAPRSPWQTPYAEG